MILLPFIILTTLRRPLYRKEPNVLRLMPRHVFLTLQNQRPLRRLTRYLLRFIRIVILKRFILRNFLRYLKRHVRRFLYSLHQRFLYRILHRLLVRFIRHHLRPMRILSFFRNRLIRRRARPILRVYRLLLRIRHLRPR